MGRAEAKGRQRLDVRLRRAGCSDWRWRSLSDLGRSFRAAGGFSVRQIGKSVGLSSTRVHQLLANPGATLTEHALSALRELGWPAPEVTGAGDQQLVADRLVDEAALLLSCAGWLEQLDAGGFPPVINLRPDDDWAADNAPSTALGWPGSCDASLPTSTSSRERDVS